MRKTMILFMIGIILLLGACNQSNNLEFDRLSSFTNKNINTSSEINTQMERFKTTLSEYIFQEDASLLNVQYPISATNLDIPTTGLTFYEVVPDSISRAYTLITSLEYLSNIIEGETINLGGTYSNFGEVTIQMNNDELYIIHYKLDDLGRVNGTFAYLSLLDDLLYVETSFVSYDCDENYYSSHVDSIYSEGSFEYMLLYYSHDGQFTGLYRMYRDFEKDTFFSCKIDNSSDNLVYYIYNYDPETETYTSLRNIDGEFSNFTIIKYENQDFLYKIIDNSNLFVKYNLKYIEEWDSLQLVDNDETLYYNDTIVELPDRLEISVDEYLGVMLSGTIYSGDIEGVINLEGSVLTSVLTYQEYVLAKASSEEIALSLYEAFSEQFFKNMKNDSEVVFMHLDKNAFKRITE
ncbi:MAG: hypothetical protein JEZ05_10720 [Tenericutes bacterium]|nr:hypothetical protein [Mycoplasmatota bacterium]